MAHTYFIDPKTKHSKQYLKQTITFFTILLGRTNRAPNPGTWEVAWRVGPEPVFPDMNHVCRVPRIGSLRNVPSTCWAPLLPKDITVQTLAPHFCSLEAPASISLTTSICDSILGAQGWAHCIWFTDNQAAGSSYDWDINWEKKLPKETTPLQVWNLFLNKDINS